MINKKEIKNKILEKIKEEKGLFFPDIEQIFKDEKYDFKGDKVLYLLKDDGTTNYSQIVWSNWSQEAVDIIYEILNENKGEIGLRCFTNPLEILLSGGGLNLPISKDFNKTYKKPHWTPSSIEYILN